MAARKKPASTGPVDVTGRATWPAGWDHQDLKPAPAKSTRTTPATSTSDADEDDD
jgi:hypothetical protein